MHAGFVEAKVTPVLDVTVRGHHLSKSLMDAMYVVEGTLWILLGV
jgi:hypothetical protein